MSIYKLCFFLAFVVAAVYASSHKIRRPLDRDIERLREVVDETEAIINEVEDMEQVGIDIDMTWVW